MIPNNKLLIAAGAVAIATGMYTSAVTAASISTASASANVLTPMTITENAALHFGDVGVGTGGGDVVLVPTGGRSVNGDAEFFTTGTNAAGQFTITGVAGKAYTLSFPGTVDISGGTGTMNVTTFTDNSTGTMPAATETFNVGATLTIGGSQPAGAYSNTYTVTVNYQ